MVICQSQLIEAQQCCSIRKVAEILKDDKNI